MARYGREPGSGIRLYADCDQAEAAFVCRTDGDRRLQGASNFYSVEHGPIHQVSGAGATDTVLRLAHDIAREQASRHVIRLAALDPAEPEYAAVRDGLRSAGWIVKPFFDSGTWFEDTRGLDFRCYFDERPGIITNTYRRRAARAKSQQLDYLLPGGGSEIENFIADYLTVYRNSWKDSEPFPDFIPKLIRWAFSLGALRCGVARVDGVPAAAQFWIVWHGRAVIYKLAHDQRFDRLSPGTLLTMRMMEHVLEHDRPDEVNFGRGDDPYKKLWLSQRRERWGLFAVNPRTLHGAALGLRMLAGALRDRMVRPSVGPRAHRAQ